MVDMSFLNGSGKGRRRLAGLSLRSLISLKLPISFHWFGAVLSVVDAVVILALAIGAVRLTGNWAYKNFSGDRVSMIVGGFAALNFFILMSNNSMYSTVRFLQRRRLSAVARNWVFVIVAIVIMEFLAGTTSDEARVATISFFIGGVVLLPALSVLAKSALDIMIQNDGLKARRRVVVFGELASAHATRVLAQLQMYGFEVVARVDTTGSNPDGGDNVIQLFNHVRYQGAEEVLLILCCTNREMLRRTSQRLQQLPVPVRLILDDQTDWLLSMPNCDLGLVKAVKLQGGSLSVQAQFAKRTFDLIFASIGLLILAPLFLVVALAIWMEAGSPIIFRQRRIGFGGRIFDIYKFRSMYTLENGLCIPQATKNDSRVTRVGRFIRRTSIDELPQLVNIIRGDMSIVGPRPHALAHDDQYSKVIRSYARRHHMKPGLTGWAQVNGCRGETPHVAAMEMRVRYDIWYIKHWSMAIDILAVLKTLLQVVLPKNVY